MKKISFLGNSSTPQDLLKLFSKMTPGKSGKWGQLEGTGNIEEADYFVVIDRIPQNYRKIIPENKTIFLGAHPETLSAYQDMSKFNAFAKFDLKKEIGFLEWWIKYDYDYLSNLLPMSKTKLFGTIISDGKSREYQILRRQYLETFCNNYPNQIDIYGRIIPWGSLIPHYKGVCGQMSKKGDYWSGKEIVYEQYKYVLEHDGVGKYYFSERILDAMLLWSMPIYWGGQNVQLVLPENSFKYFDIKGNGKDVIDIINSNFYEEHLEDLSKARQILLNEQQIWPKVHKAIFGFYK